MPNTKIEKPTTYIKHLSLRISVLSILICLLGCGQSSTPITTSAMCKGAATTGNYIGFEIDLLNNTWIYTDYTSAETLTGLYSIIPGNIFLVTKEARSSSLVKPMNVRAYNWEDHLGQLLLVVPIIGLTAETEPIAVSTTVDESETSFDGSYLVIDYGREKSWGTYEVGANGMIGYTYYDLVTPEIATKSVAAKSYTCHSGIITVDEDPEARIIISSKEVMVIANGPGRGFSVGIKKPVSATLESGTYGCIDQKTGAIGAITLEVNNNSQQLIWSMNNDYGSGTLECIMPGAMKYTETENPNKKVPTIVIVYPGKFIAGIKKTENNDDDIGGFLGSWISN